MGICQLVDGLSNSRLSHLFPFPREGFPLQSGNLTKVYEITPLLDDNRVSSVSVSLSILSGVVGRENKLLFCEVQTLHGSRQYFLVSILFLATRFALTFVRLGGTRTRMSDVAILRSVHAFRKGTKSRELNSRAKKLTATVLVLPAVCAMSEE